MIDTHCHIDDPVYQDDWNEFIRLQQAEGVERILVPGIDADSIEPVRKVCESCPDYLLPAIGLHPENVKDDWKEHLRRIREELEMNTGNYVAIGEIGLDYHFDTTFKKEQAFVLRTQLDWALEYNLPVMIHSRDATEDILNIIQPYTQHTSTKTELRGVMHCFSGSNEVAKKLVNMGFYLGIGGVITFKNCHLRDNLAGIPLSRIVLETDAPYMAPVPHRGERNESRFMTYVANVLAEVYNSSFEEVNAVTSANARELFGLN